MNRFVGIKNRQFVSGEFLIIDGKLHLRLRLDDKVIFSALDAVDPAHPDILLALAAHSVLLKTQPYFLASIEYKENEDEAIDILNRIYRDKNELPAKIHALKCTIYRSSHKYDESLEQCNIAIKTDPLYVGGYNNRGQLYLDMGDNQKAVEDFEKKAKSVDGSAIFVHNNLGIALSREGMIEEAKNEYIRAISIDHNSAPPHNNLGLLFAKIGKSDDAISEYLTAIDLDIEYIEPHINLSKIYRSRGRNDDAIKECIRILEIDENNGFAKDCLVTAAEDYTKVTKMGIDEFSYVMLAKVYASMGKTNKAILQYTKALEYYATNVSVLRELGNAYVKNGNKEKGEQFLRKANEIAVRRIE